MERTKIYLKSGLVIETAGEKLKTTATTRNGTLTNISWENITHGERALYVDLHEIVAVTEIMGETEASK